MTGKTCDTKESGLPVDLAQEMKRLGRQCPFCSRVYGEVELLAIVVSQLAPHLLGGVQATTKTFFQGMFNGRKKGVVTITCVSPECRRQLRIEVKVHGSEIDVSVSDYTRDVAFAERGPKHLLRT